MERETVEVAKQKTTFDTSYYVSNSAIESSSIQALTEELAGAIRFHWGVESNNWIRDVTFNEDHIKTKAGNQAQIMALLRGLAIELIRKTSPKNFQAAIENLSDSVDNLESMLRQVKFLWESRGDPGLIAVLHTHARNLDYHPHIHTIMPAIVVDRLNKLVRTKHGKYLFNHKALAKVFRGKLLSKLAKENLVLPQSVPQKWIVNCKKVGSGGKALVYLGRYLYRGVIREQDILSVHDGKVTFRYQNSETKRWETRTETGAKFLWRVLQHVLPTGFRRARNYGFLHPNSKKMINILLTLGKLTPKKMLEKIGLRQRPQMTCTCCGGKMQVNRTRIPLVEVFRVKMNGQALVPT